MYSRLLKISTPSLIHFLGGLALRGLVYAVLSAALAYGMLWGAVTYGPVFYAEIGPVEVLETVFALLTAVVFLSAGRRDREREFLVIPAALFLFCIAIRESDYFLDELVARHAWKMFVALVLVFLAVYIAKNAKRVVAAILDFLKQSAFGILLSGLLVVLVFSRLMGYGDLWEKLLGQPGQHKFVKTIVEESTELMGYFLIWVSSCEYLHAARIARRNESDTPPQR